MLLPHYVFMEYTDGGTLNDVIHNQGQGRMVRFAQVATLRRVLLCFASVGVLTPSKFFQLTLCRRYYAPHHKSQVRFWHGDPSADHAFHVFRDAELFQNDSTKLREHKTLATAGTTVADAATAFCANCEHDAEGSSKGVEQYNCSGHDQLPLARILRYGIEMADGLQWLHENGILHRGLCLHERAVPAKTHTLFVLTVWWSQSV